MAAPQLVELDQTVQAAVALELGEGGIDPVIAIRLASTRTRQVAGLTVVSTAAADADVSPDAARRYDRLLRYRADRGILQAKLKRVGVTPLAVLPRTAWEQICDSAELYRFQPIEGDRVRADLTELTKQADSEVRQEAERTYVAPGLWKTHKWPLSFLAINIGLFCLGFFTGYPGFYVLGAFCFIVTFVSFAICDSSEPSVPSGKVTTRFNEILTEKVRNGTLVSTLWPTFKEPENGSYVRISLPTPPSDVQEVITRAERSLLPLNLAAVGDAITIRPEGLQDLIVAEQNRMEREEALRRDPIVFVVEGSAVGILAQFGDFPIEEQVINQVVNSIHLV